MKTNSQSIVRSDSIIWVLLLALTLTGYAIVDSSVAGRLALLAILGAAAIKFFLIAYSYMELKDAHILWRLIMAAYLLILLGLILAVL